MDLGCFDSGCISVSDKCSDSDSRSTQIDSGVTPTSASTSEKMNKHPQRKTSPIHWFPRKKGNSYLNRKIKMMQEGRGMNSTLDETLGDSHPHYCRVLREQMVAREATEKAVETRKAAFIEASWCRILRASRIPSKEAEALMLKAEAAAVEAFEAATAVGVIMQDKPNSSRNPSQTASSPGNGWNKIPRSVAASFETAFEVDRQVAAAVKTAFVRLARCADFSKDKFEVLLKRICFNPEDQNGTPEIGMPSDSDSELEPPTDDSHLEYEQKTAITRMMLQKDRGMDSGKLNMAKLVDMMFERLQCLQEDELSSLATIVATCGLNAALADTKLHVSASDSSYAPNFTQRTSSMGATGRCNEELMIPSLDKFLVKHKTKLEREVEEAKKNSWRNMSNLNLDVKKIKNEAAWNKHEATQDLGSVLVKHTSRLQREIDEAKKNQNGKRKLDKDKTEEAVFLDLGSVLVKRSSKFEIEMQEAKNDKRMSIGTRKNSKRNLASSEAIPDLGTVLSHSSKLEKGIKERRNDCESVEKLERTQEGTNSFSDVPSLENFLVKHISSLERDVQEARDRYKAESETFRAKKVRRSNPTSISEVENIIGKENINLNNECPGSCEIETNGGYMVENEPENAGIPTSVGTEVLAKPAQRLETEKPLQELSNKADQENYRVQQEEKECGNFQTDWESLDKVLVKRVSRLEKEKMSYKEEKENVKRGHQSQSEVKEGGLDQILVKHTSRLQKDIACAATATDRTENHARLSHAARKEARERELQEVWGGLSLVNSMRPHLSKLERDKAAWIKAEENGRKQAL